MLVIESHEAFRRQIVNHLIQEGCRVIEACEEAKAPGILRRKDVAVASMWPLIGMHFT